MRGHDRRSAAACPCLAAHEVRYTPVRVVELELDRPEEMRSPGGLGPVVPCGRVSALVRLHGHPLGLVQADGSPGDPAGLRRALVAAARRRLPPVGSLPASRPEGTAAPPEGTAARPEAVARIGAGPAPVVSVIVTTRNRPGSLGRCLDSLLRTRYPHLEVLVVDNTPTADRARDLVLTGYPPWVRYLREPRPGPARAHHRGLAAAHGPLVAFTDVEAMVDPGWPWALAAAFAADPTVGCVTGLVLAAEQETAEQAALEARCGRSDRFTPRRWSLDEPSDSPLRPFLGAHLGVGQNLAFRTELLRRLGGFAPAAGSATPARDSDELLAVFRILVAGAALCYCPDALVWRHHPRTATALPAQAHRFGDGGGAHLAGPGVSAPGLGVGLGADGAQLARLELRDRAYGPVGCLRGASRRRRG